jgi:hypothetical protein
MRLNFWSHRVLCPFRRRRCHLPAHPGDPVWLFSSFFLEFFPPEFDCQFGNYLRVTEGYLRMAESPL